MHKYFLSYVVTVKDVNKYGNIVITLENPITVDDILEFEKETQERLIGDMQNAYCSVNVIFYKVID